MQIISSTDADVMTKEKSSGLKLNHVAQVLSIKPQRFLDTELPPLREQERLAI